VRGVGEKESNDELQNHSTGLPAGRAGQVRPGQSRHNASDNKSDLSTEQQQHEA
jgi:hypothetical protein